MSGHGNEDHAISLQRIGIAMAAVCVLAIAEVAIGLTAHSLALVGDAGHLTTDMATLALTSWALTRSRRPANARNTFGYLRTGILVATINALLLLGVAAALTAAAIGRLHHPADISAGPVLIIALVALAGDCALAAMLHSGDDLNMRSAAWHIAGDALAAAGVLGAALIILLTGWIAADTVVSFGIAALIALGGLILLRDTTHILNESTPRDLDAEDVRSAMVAVDGVVDVHDLHIWSLDKRHRALSAHITVGDQSLAQVTTLLRTIESTLCERFDIEHATLQPECPTCVGDASLFCAIEERHDVFHATSSVAMRESGK